MSERRQHLERFFANYGMVFALLFLVLLFTFLTWKDQALVGPEAGRQVAESILSQDGQAVVVIVGGQADQAFVDAASEKIDIGGAMVAAGIQWREFRLLRIPIRRQSSPCQLMSRYYLSRPRTVTMTGCGESQSRNNVTVRSNVGSEDDGATVTVKQPVCFDNIVSGRPPATMQEHPVFAPLIVTG